MGGSVPNPGTTVVNQSFPSGAAADTGPLDVARYTQLLIYLNGTLFPATDPTTLSQVNDDDTQTQLATPAAVATGTSWFYSWGQTGIDTIVALLPRRIRFQANGAASNVWTLKIIGY